QLENVIPKNQMDSNITLEPLIKDFLEQNKGAAVICIIPMTREDLLHLDDSVSLHHPESKRCNFLDISAPLDNVLQIP
ncbi:hypothetical protein HDV01_004936, partial [Terramyces sp. JEL0728]